MTRNALPRRPRAVLAYGGATLVVIALVWIVGAVLRQLWLVTIALAVSLLLTALFEPTARVLRRWSLPGWLAALLCVLGLLAVPAGIGFLLVSRALSQLGDVTDALTTAVNGLRDWLVHGPLNLSSAQIDSIRADIVQRLQSSAPSITASATAVATAGGAVILIVFVVFLLLKDGSAMWGWMVGQVAPRHRDRLDAAGQNAWHTLTRYVGTTVIIAILDAVFIGLGLVFIGVPLALPLALLVFLGGFVPILGATVSGMLAALVALVTEGLTSALLVLAVVIVVQQVEGNFLQPVLMGNAVSLHPVVILVAITAGTLLLGIAGAIVAVPFVAIVYSVVKSVRGNERAKTPPTSDEGTPGQT